MDKLRYTFQLPAVSAPDVITRELTHTAVGIGDTVYNLGAATDKFVVVVEEGTDNVLALVDVDNAGNRSSPSIHAWTAADTFSPPKPNTLAIIGVEEVFEEASSSEFESFPEPESSEESFPESELSEESFSEPFPEPESSEESEF